MTATFYDRTALWWGSSRTGPRDRLRAATVDAAVPPGADVLELGCGCGGSAAAIADLGHDVLAVDASRTRIAMARRHLRTTRPGRLVVLVEDFLTMELDRCFDAVVYWSGFGLGPEAGHARILRRVQDWLRVDGLSFVDVFDDPWWRTHSGAQRQHGSLVQRIDYDPASRRLVDRWWPEGRPDRAVREEIRCYGAAEFAALAADAGLRVVAAAPAPSTGDELSTMYTLRRGRCQIGDDQ